MEVVATRTGFMRKARLEKAIHSLMGVLEGVALDGVLNPDEVSFLRMWTREHLEFADLHPINEILPPLMHALEDGVVDNEEQQDLLWLCRRLSGCSFYDEITVDLQRFHGVLAGVIADTVISKAELEALRDWMEDHPHLLCRWPFDEVGSLIHDVLLDGVVTPAEHKTLLSFFANFLAIGDDVTITSPYAAYPNIGLAGVCAVAPDIQLQGRTFCLTGSFTRHKKAEIGMLIERRQGGWTDSLSKSIHYLVVGGKGNPNWAYACYGRKVERAMEYRQAGGTILIVHEVDLLDALQ